MAPLERAYFGMQCFWGESAFAKIKGVQKTRVGYAGGTTPAPTYRNIGDHTEVTEVQFDPDLVGYAQLVHFFWTHHDPSERRKKQYQSAILYVNDRQKAEAEKTLEEQKKKYARGVETYVVPLDKFHQAEDYHQKYWLRSNSVIYKGLGLNDEQIVDSVLAAKVNAFLAGYQDWAVLEALKKEFGLREDVALLIRKVAEAGGDPRACH